MDWRLRHRKILLNKSQLEEIEATYPLLKVNGLTLATGGLRLLECGVVRDVLGYLEVLEVEYLELIRNRRPFDMLES